MKRSLIKLGIVIAIMMTISVNQLMAFTAVASGNWSNAATWGGVAPGATVTNQDIIIPLGLIVNLDMNVSFGGLLNTFTVNGTLSTASNFGVTMTQGAFSGAGSVTIQSLTFAGLLATMPYTGNLTVHSFQNDGATLALAAVVSVSDTLDLLAGSLSVNSGANLTAQSNSTIKMAAGTLTVVGGVFNSGTSYNVMYLGASKTAGIELNTVTLNNLYLRMSTDADAITTAGNLQVNGTLYTTRGTLNFSGRQLTLMGNYVVSNGATLQSDALSSLTLEGAPNLTSGLAFKAGAALYDLTIDKPGSADIMLNSDLHIAGSLRLTDGVFSLQSGDTLTMNAGSMIDVVGGSLASNGGGFVGTASYDVTYMGLGNTSGLELSGSGLNNVDLALTSASAQITQNSDVDVAGAMTMDMGKWNLNGNDLSLYGTLDQSAAASFVGNVNSMMELDLTATSLDTLSFDNSNQSLKQLILNLPPASSIVLGSGLTIVNELTMTKGKLDIAANDLVLQSAAAITGYSDSDYVVTSGIGRLQMNVNSGAPYVTFPIGTMAAYSPAMLQQTASGTSGSFMASTRTGFLAQGISGFNYATSGSLVDRTWMIEAGGGMTVNMNMKLAWTAVSEVNGFDATHAFITHYTNAAWDAYPEGAASVGLFGTAEITRTGITSLSPFGVVDTALALSIPATAIMSNYQLYPNPAATVIHVDFAAGNERHDFQISDLTGKVMLRETNVSGSNSMDVSLLSSGCYIMKVTEVGNGLVSIKKFIKE